MKISKVFILLVFLTLNLQAICKDLELTITSQQDVFIAGSTIEFKFDGNNTKINSNVYLEIVDADNSIIQAEIYKIDKIPYQNKIKLSSNLISGNYILNSFNLIDNYIISSEPITVINLENYSLGNANSSKVIEYDTSSIGEHVSFSFKKNIKGILKKEGEPQKNASVFIQCIGEDNLFRISKTDANGVFEFHPTIYGTNKVYIEQLEESQSNGSIEIINNDYLNLLKLKESKPLPYHSEKLKKIDSSTIKKLVKQHADELKSEQDRENIGGDIVFDESIVAADYFTLGSTSEFILELVPYKKIKTKKNDTRFYLLNKFSSSYYKKEPLYLIDGFIVPNIETILNVKIENLESIDVSYSSQDNLKFFGELAFYGIIQLNTKEGTYKPKSGVLMTLKGFSK